MPGKSFAESLKFIINHELNKNRPCSTHLGPPLTKEKITEIMLPLLSSIHMGLHEDILKLYKTTDGINMDVSQLAFKEIWLLPGYYLMSLEEAVETYNTMVESAKSDGQDWDNSWFPFLSSGAGDFYFINMSDGTVNEFIRGEDVDDEAKFENMADFFQQAVQHFEDGDFYMDEEGQLQEN
ncbi:hypothetical protein ACJMK2_043514 [Sinanodonta woodiana]|uniref:Knr4/Smi1-like domain-containing protein n=1 Tax=Sinanodonta woodiana TaxID=1069815 RepID=A0ABD3VX50_SINWO